MPSIVAVLNEIVRSNEEEPWNPTGTRDRLAMLNDAQLSLLAKHVGQRVDEGSPHRRKVNLNFHAAKARPPQMHQANETILRLAHAVIDSRKDEREREAEEAQQRYLQEHGKELRRAAEEEARRKLVEQVRRRMRIKANKEVREQEADRIRIDIRTIESRRSKATTRAERLFLLAVGCIGSAVFCAEYLIIEARNLAIAMATIFCLVAAVALYVGNKIRKVDLVPTDEADLLRQIQTRTDDYMAKWDLDRQRKEQRAKDERRARRLRERERKRGARAAKDLVAKRRRDFTTESVRSSMDSTVDEFDLDSVGSVGLDSVGSVGTSTAASHADTADLASAAGSVADLDFELASIADTESDVELGEDGVLPTQPHVALDVIPATPQQDQAPEFPEYPETADPARTSSKTTRPSAPSTSPLTSPLTSPHPSTSTDTRPTPAPAEPAPPPQEPGGAVLGDLVVEEIGDVAQA